MENTRDATCKTQEIEFLAQPWASAQNVPEIQDLDRLKGYTSIEIYNGLIFRLTGTGLATDVWDYLLSRGRLVWGFGNDDFHRWYDLARTYNMIYSSRKDFKAVQDSIQNSSFYVSTGMELTGFECDQEFVRISARAANKHVKENKYIFTGKNGEVLSEQCGEYGLYKIRGDEMYIRVQVISEHGAMLWTQPVYDEARFKKV